MGNHNSEDYVIRILSETSTEIDKEFVDRLIIPGDKISELQEKYPDMRNKMIFNAFRSAINVALYQCRQENKWDIVQVLKSMCIEMQKTINEIRNIKNNNLKE